MSVFNASSISHEANGSKETNFEDHFNDPFEILVNPTNPTTNSSTTKETTAQKQQASNNQTKQNSTNELFDTSTTTSKPFNQSITTQDLFSDNFLNEQFTPFDSINNPFSGNPEFNQSAKDESNPFNASTKSIDDQELTKLTNSRQSSTKSNGKSPEQQRSTHRRHKANEDFDKITQLNSESDEIDESLSNEETGDFATIAIQEQQQQNNNQQKNLAKNVSDFNKIKKSINEKQLYLASCLLNDASNGLHSECNYDSKSLYLYSIYRHFYLQYLLYILILLHHSLAFVEEIGLSREYAKYDSLTITFEFICLTYYAIRLAIRASILPSYRFYSDLKNTLLLLLLFITSIDIITYLSIPSKHAYRWSIVLRPFFVLNFAENRSIRRLIRNIRNVIPQLLNVLVLLLLSISIFSLVAVDDNLTFKIVEPLERYDFGLGTMSVMLFLLPSVTVAVKLFKDIELRSPNQMKPKNQLENYLDFYYFLYVLLTTANNPELMMPAYRLNKWFSLFFISFFILNLYLFMNIILAVIYNNFRKHLKLEVKGMLETRKTSLLKSFECMVRNNVMNLDESMPVFNENEGLNSDQFKMLLTTYFKCWKNASTIRFRKNSVDSYNYLIQVYWKLLESGNSLITWKEYQNLCDLLMMDMKVIDLNKLKQEANEVKFPKLYNSVTIQLLIKLVKSKYFRYFFDTVIFLNSLFVAFDLNYYQQIELAILILFMLEIGMKIYTFNLKNFLAKYWNIFDVLVVGFSFISMTIGLWINSSTLVNYGELVIILRVLRLSKWLKKVDRFNLVVRTITNILPYISLYSILMLLLFYAYAVIGMTLLRHLITPEIIGNDCTIIKTILNRTSAFSITTPTKMRYCELNFNTLSSSFMVLFDMMVVNQWHVISDNFETVVGSRFTRLYFVSFHLICVIVLLNIFTAFVLEAFILEYLNTSGVGLAITDTDSELKKRIAQLGLECKSSILNLLSITESDPLDADHDQLDYQLKQQNDSIAEDGGCELDGRHQNSFSVISISPQSNLRVLIRENRTVEQLLFRMFRDELSKQL